MNIGQIMANGVWTIVLAMTILGSFNSIFAAVHLLTHSDRMTAYVMQKIERSLALDSIGSSIGWAILIIYFFN